MIPTDENFTAEFNTWTGGDETSDVLLIPTLPTIGDTMIVNGVTFEVTMVPKKHRAFKLTAEGL